MSVSQTIVLASNNSGKFKEFNALFKPLGITLCPQTQFASIDVEETGSTFVENALLKAREACRVSGLPALADDSGLEVDALQGAPGVFSARYAGEGSSDGDNNRKLLEAMVQLPEGQRTARYWCVLTLLRSVDDPVPLVVQASWEGEILARPRGEGGFGYDSLFWIPEKAMSVAELSAQEKNRLSHRGRALQMLIEQLR
ncbi:RdgB/HAM1 family non-canonical purine NTP pyrophosphatase [Halomonas sp. M20]|uniref:RdgB/HAM1 family non-canonical purine NTP pyrophosphatase n=1 Tax=Halomonas sp. M20 TaxID=2763264 RepID=UPI001D0A7894|nr:RdgB/HAM1 family non-canonical purine NTP pyrophosphatase [Halomonas sp. M20]